MEPGPRPAQPNAEHILFVEDDGLLGEAIRLLIKRRLGCEVRLAKDVLSAASSLLHHMPALVVLDLMLPQGDAGRLPPAISQQPTIARLLARLAGSASLDAGLELLRWLREDETTARIPVIVFSGHADVGDGYESLDERVVFVPKGSAPGELLRHVRSALSH